MPNFRGRRHQRPRDLDLGDARARRQRLYVQLRSAQGRERRHPDAFGLDHPAVHRRRTNEGGDGKKLHPTRSRKRCSRASCSPPRPDDLVLDPFCGTGTTGAVAKRLGRRFVGVEREDAYAQAAEKRIARTERCRRNRLPRSLTAREAPRVAFASLIERGLISPGASSSTPSVATRRSCARTARLPLARLSVRSTVSARSLGAWKPAGWTFWHVKRPTA